MRRHKSGANALTRRNFSLIEMLAVIAIIAILAGLSFGAYNAIMKRKAKTRTEATVNAISIAIRAFKTKYGYFPQAHDAITPAFSKKYSSSSLQNPPGGTALLTNGKLIFGKDFVEFIGAEVIKNSVIKVTPATVSVEDSIYVFVDGYKDPVVNMESSTYKLHNTSGKRNVFYYKCPGVINKESFDLFSAGPDRRFGTEDDIWPQGLRKNTDPN